MAPSRPSFRPFLITLPLLAIAAANAAGQSLVSSNPSVQCSVPAQPSSGTYLWETNPYVHDDGSSESSVGVVGCSPASTIKAVWIQRFDTTDPTERIGFVSTCFGSHLYPGFAPPDGTPVGVGIYRDDLMDGDPNTSTLLASATSTIQNVDTDIYNHIPIPVTEVSGPFFVAVLCDATCDTAASEYPAPLDTSVGSYGRAWFAYNDPSTGFDPGSLSGLTLPPVELDAAGLPGVWLLRAGRVAPFPCYGGNRAVTREGARGSDYVLNLVDLVREPFPDPNTNWDAPMFHNEHSPSAPSEIWNLENLGQVFGVCFDEAWPPNIYVAATSTYTVDHYTTTGGSGAVYRIDGVTGDISTFLTTGSGAIGTATLPNDALVEPGLGDICYDRWHDQFFVSNFEDGKIYRIKNGVVAQAFDPFAADNDLPGYAPLGERVWALQVPHPRLLFFSIWSRDSGRRTVDQGGGPTNNPICRVLIGFGGDLLPNTEAVVRELPKSPLEPDPQATWSAPCSDITFSSDGKRMLIAERGMYDDTTPAPHEADVLEFIGGFTDSPRKYLVGDPPGHNASGGATYAPDLSVTATGDALHNTATTYIYGVQWIPPGGNVINGIPVYTQDSRLHDMNRDTTQYDKTETGDIELYINPAVRGRG